MHVLLLAPSRSASRAGRSDPVVELGEALAPLGLRRPLERTMGEEAIVVLDRAEQAVEAICTTAELGGWCVGLGVGGVDAPLPAEVRALRGPAVDAARQALRAARATAQVPLSVRAGDPRHAATAADAEAVLRLIGWMIATRSTGQWRVVRALRGNPQLTQRDLAALLGITQQTVSRSLKTSGWREESAAHPLLVRLLAMIDLTS